MSFTPFPIQYWLQSKSLNGLSARHTLTHTHTGWVGVGGMGTCSWVLSHPTNQPALLSWIDARSPKREGRRNGHGAAGSLYPAAQKRSDCIHFRVPHSQGAVQTAARRTLDSTTRTTLSFVIFFLSERICSFGLHFFRTIKYYQRKKIVVRLKVVY